MELTDLTTLTEDERVVAERAIEEHRQAAAEARAEQQRLAERRVRASALMEHEDDRTITVHVATQDTDLTEGKGGRRDCGAFLYAEDAALAHEVLDGVMGTANYGEPHKVEVHLTFEDWLTEVQALDQQRPHPSGAPWLNSKRVGIVKQRLGLT